MSGEFVGRVWSAGRSGLGQQTSEMRPQRFAVAVATVDLSRPVFNILPIEQRPLTVELTVPGPIGEVSRRPWGLSPPPPKKLDDGLHYFSKSNQHPGT